MRLVRDAVARRLRHAETLPLRRVSDWRRDVCFAHSLLGDGGSGVALWQMGAGASVAALPSKHVNDAGGWPPHLWGECRMLKTFVGPVAANSSSSLARRMWRMDLGWYMDCV